MPPEQQKRLLPPKFTMPELLADDSSTVGSSSDPLTPKHGRDKNPQDYPCWVGGHYQHVKGCNKKCCINPAVTPDGEDSPKWIATLASRTEDGSNIVTPVSAPPDETPPKTVLPWNYDSTCGRSPPFGEGWQVVHTRVNTDRPGVPGDTFDDPFCLATPTREKKASKKQKVGQ